MGFADEAHIGEVTHGILRIAVIDGLAETGEKMQFIEHCVDRISWLVNAEHDCAASVVG